MNNLPVDLSQNNDLTGVMITSMSNTYFGPNTEITFGCRPGFIPVSFKGQNKIKCKSDGSWTDYPLALRCKSRKK